MNRFVVKLLPLLLLSVYNIAKAQDIILKLSLNEKPIYCKDICIQNSHVSFKNIGDEKTYEYSLGEISRINFYANQPNEIYIPKLELDTIKCKVDSITLTQLFFRIGNSPQQELKKENVYCVLFNGLGSEAINLYKDKFYQLNSIQYSNKPKIVRKDGTQIGVSSIISLNNDRIEFRLFENGARQITYVDIKDIASYVNKEPIGERKTIPTSDFILSNENKFLEAIITHVNDATIDYIVNSAFKTLSQKLEKDKMVGVFFFDYSAKKIYDPSNVVITRKNETRKFKRVRFDFNAGTGYLLAKASDKLTNEQKKYVNEMRLGFDMDMNFNVFLIKEFGFGVKFNQFSTSNSLGYEYEDNIKVNFFGFSLQSQTEFPSSRGSFYTGISFGYLSEVNHAKVTQVKKKIEGETLGVYLFAGVDFFVNENLSIGIKSGLMNGKLEKVKIDGESSKLPEKENLQRWDGLVNLKIYF
jgi:hypothetical protein